MGSCVGGGSSAVSLRGTTTLIVKLLQSAATDHARAACQSSGGDDGLCPSADCREGLLAAQNVDSQYSLLDSLVPADDCMDLVPSTLVWPQTPHYRCDAVYRLLFLRTRGAGVLFRPARYGLGAVRSAMFFFLFINFYGVFTLMFTGPGGFRPGGSFD